MTGGGLYSAGRGSREYPGHELTNSVRVLPHLLLSVFLSGGALFIRHNRRASGAHYISHRMLYDMNGVRLALFVSASSCECLPIENITHDCRFYYYYWLSISLQNEERRSINLELCFGDCLIDGQVGICFLAVLNIETTIKCLYNNITYNIWHML